MNPTLGFQRSLALVFLSALLGVAFGVLTAPPALAACTLQDAAKIGYDAGASVYMHGEKGRVYVNSFDTTQCSSVRSIDMFRANGDQVEVGWLNQGGQNSLFFYVNVENGHYHPYFTNTAFGPGTWQNFQLANSNQNNWWAINLNGTYIDSVLASFKNGQIVTTNSERDYSQDSLWSHFMNLQDCSDCGSGYHNFQNLQLESTLSHNAGDYSFCKVSNSEHYVKQSC